MSLGVANLITQEPEKDWLQDRGYRRGPQNRAHSQVLRSYQSRTRRERLFPWRPFEKFLVPHPTWDTHHNSLYQPQEQSLSAPETAFISPSNSLHQPQKLPLTAPVTASNSPSNTVGGPAHAIIWLLGGDSGATQCGASPKSCPATWDGRSTIWRHKKFLGAARCTTKTLRLMRVRPSPQQGRHCKTTCCRQWERATPPSYTDEITVSK